MVQIEELAELQDIVEHGPDWNELVIGTITLQRRLEALPSRTAEQLQSILASIELDRGKIVFRQTRGA